jgi:hypothetical protein
VWQTLKKIIHDCLTENDATSYDPIRVGGFVLSLGAIPTYIFGGIRAAIEGHFDFTSFGTGFAAICGGIAVVGVGIAAKAFTDKP